MVGASLIKCLYLLSSWKKGYENSAFGNYIH